MVFGAKGARQSGSLGPGVTQNLVQITASIRVWPSHTTVSSPHWKLEPKDYFRPDWSRLQLMLSRQAAIAPGGTAICEHVRRTIVRSFFTWMTFNLHHAHEHSATHNTRPLDHTMRYAGIKRSWLRYIWLHLRTEHHPRSTRRVRVLQYCNVLQAASKLFFGQIALRLG